LLSGLELSASRIALSALAPNKCFTLY
jgi:hypothetical protein